MSDGSCKRIRDMMHRYELDLLSETEKEEFELHLLECESCFENARQFKEAARHLVHSENVKKSVERMVDEHQRNTRPKERGPQGMPIWKRYAIAAAAVLVVIFLVFQPWQIEFRPMQEARATENMLAVMYFINTQDKDDSESLGRIITNLVITDLSESKAVQVVSSQRLEDLQNLTGQETNSSNPKAAARLAQKVNARWVLLGRIMKTEPAYLIRTELVDAATGKVISIQEISGEDNEDIFGLVDKITVAVKNDLALQFDFSRDEDRKIADVTTSSPEAYLYYLDGIANYSKLYFQEAYNGLHRAVELDSTFAMAYYYLALLGDRNSVNLAVKYADQASIREQYYIKALAARDRFERREILEELIERFPYEKVALFYLGMDDTRNLHFDSATVFLKRAIEIDPLYKDAYNQLCYVYCELDDFANAIWASNKYISLGPDEANPYDTQGDMYAYFGEIDRAIASYKKSVELKPDYHASIVNLGNMYLIKRDFRRADSCYKYLEANFAKNFRIGARLDMTNIPLRQGKFKETLELLETSFAKEAPDLKVVREAILACNYHVYKATILTEAKEFDEAIKEIKEGMHLFYELFSNNNDEYLKIYTQILAAKGDYKAAWSEADELKKRLQHKNSSPYLYLSAAGYIALEEGDFPKAIEFLENITGKTTIRQNFTDNYQLARAYLGARRLNEAVTLFENLQKRYTNIRAGESVKDIKMHYLLGKAYEESRWYDKAIEQYSIFLEAWENADSDIPEIPDARTRLGALKALP